MCPRILERAPDTVKFAGRAESFRPVGSSNRQRSRRRPRCARRCAASIIRARRDKSPCANERWKPMAGANVLEFTSANWDQEVVKSDKPVLVDFWAPWCGPCRALAPAIERVADQFAGKVKVGKLNTDDNQDLA